MKPIKAKWVSTLISGLFLLNGASALAHSNHNQSHMAMYWVFNQKVKNKVDTILASNPKVKAIGLASLEKKIMDYYGLKAGRTFDTKLDNATWRFKRTTTGLRVIKNLVYKKSSFYNSIPVNKTARIVRIGWSQPSHPGHHHSHFHSEWVLTKSIQEKIKNNLENENQFPLVGISTLIQKKLGKYGIKPGMTFMTTVHNSQLIAKRTSSGIRIVDTIKTNEIASLPNIDDKY